MIDKETDRLENFRSGHVCPNRELHDNKDFSIEISYSNLSGIGTNHYVKCTRCGCQQDITDYGCW